MDFADIARRALAARQVSKEIDGRTFTLTLPTRHEGELLYANSAVGGFDAAARIRFTRAALCAAITGWSGVKVSDVLDDARPGERDQPVEFSPEATPLVLDQNQAWESALSVAVMEGIAKRRATEDATAKN